MNKTLEQQLDKCVEISINTWNTEDLLRLCQEECAELITALSHYHRGKEGSYHNVLEEMADTTIMLAIAMRIFVERYEGAKAEKEILDWIKEKSLRMITHAKNREDL